jgi:hypothetical protein
MEKSLKITLNNDSFYEDTNFCVCKKINLNSVAMIEVMNAKL